MKKSVKLISILVFLFAIVSCNGKEKESAEKTVRSFFAAINKEDEKKMSEFYPDYDSIGGYYKSKKIDILETNVLENERIEVKVKNYFTNGLGNKFNQQITLFLQPNPKSKQVYLIVDSKGLVGFDEQKDYQFAVNTGCIPRDNSYSDQEIAAKLKDANLLLLELSKKKLDELKKEVVVSEWKWNYAYTDNYADGKGKVTNNSQLNLSFLKYIVSFVDANGKEITQDDGYFSTNSFAPGETKTFTTFTGNIQGATAAYIAVDFDSQMIFDEVLKGKYTGNEYADFKKSKSSK